MSRGPGTATAHAAIARTRAAGLRGYVAATAVSVLLSIGIVDAAVPKVGTQAPGYYRMQVGAFEVTALSDGTFDLATDRMLADPNGTDVARLLDESFHGRAVPTSVNAYLINTGDRLVLVDTGAARLFGPTLGRLAKNLEASGYRPDQIDAVLITHMHPDHIGGLADHGRRVFPNATVHVDRREAGFWLDPVAAAHAAPDRKDFFAGARAALQPYIDAGRLRTFDGPAVLFPGIRAIPAPGHTPGHTMFAFESGGQRLLLWGDLMEVASVQFARPAVTIAYDADPVLAAGGRPAVYADVAGRRDLVGGAHLPFPGLGHVRLRDGGYEWVPIDHDDAPR